MFKKNILITTALLASSTLLAFLLFHFVPQNLPNVSLIYILGLVLICRYTSGYIYGILSSIFCVIFVNYFFTFPYFALNFTLTGYPLTFLGMLAITLITSTTTSHMKQQAKILSENEKRLMEAEKEKMRATLLRAVSHDLRTPLTSIIGAASSYRENNSSLSETEKIELADHIYDDANWLLNMVENLLSVTRIQNNNTKVKKSIEMIEEVIEEAVTRLKKRLPQARINVTIPDEVLMIPMDAMLIEQVIINLLENSIVHSESTLPTDLIITSDSKTVTFHVKDYGIGIKTESMDSIFDGLPMNTSESSDSRKGIGIGLSICKTIILAHNGTISARNHPSGAEFLFTLPKEAYNE